MTAPVPAGKTRRFRITHPFHPFRDGEFEVVEHQEVANQNILFFRDQAGYLAQIPAAWTDFVEANAFCDVAGGRSPLEADSLWLLAELLQELRKEPR